MALEQEFERAVWSTFRKAQKHGYYLRRSKDKINRVRAIAYARELIASSEMQSRFQHLKEINKLDLASEHLVAKTEVVLRDNQDGIVATIKMILWVSLIVRRYRHI